MSNYKEKLSLIFKKGNLVFLLIVFIVLIFSLLSIVWWSKKMPYLKREINNTIGYIAKDISEFDDYFMPKHFVNVLVEREQMYKYQDEEDTINLTKNKLFDTAYYYFLWEKYIAEYGFDELDSLTIDSIIKREMEIEAIDLTNSSNNMSNETQQIRKDELLHVRIITPTTYGNDSIQNVIYKQQTSNMQFKIEFWESPINFSGVKALGNVIIVYGVKEFDSIALQFDSLNNKLYLKRHNTFYQIERDGQLYPFSKLLKIN
jgi:hypothetical protein